MTDLKLLSLILLTCTMPTTADEPFAGLNGREILSKINLTMRPQVYIDRQTGDDGAWATDYGYALNDDGMLIDYYDTGHVTQPVIPPADIYLTNIAPADWWGNSDYGNAPRLDLHNIVTAGSDVSTLKSDLPPGRVTAATYDNGTWSVGTGDYLGTTAPMFTPPKGREGDFARALMYCATMYPMELWCGKGYYIFADGNYPLLTDYGKALLMDWHRLDPVDEFEQHRNQVIAARQGNANPFVSYPDLAEYIWGNHVDDTIDDDGDSDSDAAYPIKATYSLATDRYISLTSPYLPQQLTWSIDGTEATTSTIPLDTLTEGEHILYYHNSDLQGVIKIIITK